MTIGLNVLKTRFEIDFEDGFQIYHSIPDLHFYAERHFPKNLFWDVDFREIDWDKNKRWVMARVFNRGCTTEMHGTQRLQS